MTAQVLVPYHRPVVALPETAPEVLATLAPLAEIDRNPVAVYLARLRPGKSRDSMLRALRRVLGVMGAPGDPFAFPWAEMRYQHVLRIRGLLEEKPFEPATANQALSALRGVMQEAFNLELIDGDAWARIRGVKGIKATRLPAGRALPDAELAALFGACDRSDPIGIRDAALIAVLFVGGMRRAEACSLNFPDSLDMGAREARVIGKRNKERLIPLGPAMVDIEAWLEVRGREPGPLFWSFELPHGGGERPPPPWRLSDGGVYHILQRVAERAGIPPVSPHDMRRTCATDLLARGAGIEAVKEVLGHDSIATTIRYDMRGEEKKRAAVELLSIPR